MKGGGKYETETTAILLANQAEAVIVIVAGGRKGAGFSVAATSPAVLRSLVGFLRIVADEIEKDLKA